VPPETLDGYLQLALEEVLQYGADVAQVQRRVDRLLSDVAAAALPEHRDAVARVMAERACRAGALAGGGDGGEDVR
jgi:uncharacterized membrane protein